MSDLIGRRISHYRVLERLGGGGMGEVFKAEDLRLGRRVALKFLPPELGEDPVAKERFMQEARAASALDHQNICTIHDVGETEDGRLFLAMAFYDGETLKRRLASGPLPISEALGTAEQVAEGLAEAHGRGIVHRDIKPANLMLTRDGVVKIVDFGLAKLAEEPGLTKTGTSVGTPAYMSPEQARGGEVDHRTDLWSLGVVLYEMLTGRLPFTGSSQGEILHAILYDDPEPLGSLRSGIPPRVERLVDRLLTREPGERLSTAREALEAIRGAGGEVTAALDETAARPTMAWPGAEPKKGEETEDPRHRHLVLGALAVAVAVVVGVTAWWLGGSGEGGPGEPDTEQAAATPAERKRIVVLPFENLGPEEHEYFAAGMTEEITSRLARVAELGVIARTSAVQYEGTDKGITQIAEELDVGYLLEGTVRWAPTDDGSGRVRITPQLIRASDQTHLWADAYDATLEDIFAVQADIATQVIDELEVVLSGGERRAVAARPTDNHEAYEAYLRGLHHRERATAGAEAAEATVASFERAVELDPEFALAWSALSRALAALYNHGYDRSPEICPRASEAARRALELSTGISEAHLALAYYYYLCEQDYEPALESLETARRGLPSSSEVLALQSFIQRRQGRWERSTENLERAMALDPRSAVLPGQLALTYLFVGQYGTAIRLADRAAAIDPGYATPYHVKAMAVFNRSGDALGADRTLAEAAQPTDITIARRVIWRYIGGEYERALELLGKLGRNYYYLTNIYLPVELVRAQILEAMGREGEARSSYAEALAILEQELTERSDDPQVHTGLGLTHAGLGHRQEAVQHGERAVEIMPVARDAFDGTGYPVNLAETYARVGETAKACETIDEYLSIPSQYNLHWFEQHPAFAPLQDEPCFQEIQKKHPPPVLGSTADR